MDCRCQAVGMSLLALLACIPGPAHALRPLSLELKPRPTASLHGQPSGRFDSAADVTPARDARLAAQARRAQHRFKQATPSLSQQALQSLVANEPEPASAGAADASFRFRRQGSVGRVISQEYKAMCDSVSRRLWDDPAGKRVRFDVAGKPGVAIEIPLR